MREPSSFRDPSGYIFYENEKVYRSINPSYFDNFKEFINSGLYENLVSENLIVSHEVLNNVNKQKDSITLEVEKIFPITYPYEWCFSQIKDAALLTLKIQKISIEYGMILKDASAFNIQFKNNKPIFIDTLSFEKIQNDNHSWKAYKQFVEMFLNPLCLMKYVDHELNKLLQTYINGIPHLLTKNILKLKHKFIPSVFFHIVLPTKLRSNSSNLNSKKEKKITKSQQLSIIRQLESFIENLNSKKQHTEWDSYNKETLSEKEEYVISKTEIIEEFVSKKKYSLVWDIGSNDGHFSRHLNKITKSRVISMDVDLNCVERNYQINKSRSIKNVFPLFFDITNPSASIGWMNLERKGLYSRIGNPDLICLFAVMHHIINKNIPLDLILNFTLKTKSDLLIEYIPLSDPKCKIIFSSRGNDFVYPSQEQFEKIALEYFRSFKKRELKGSDRVLYFLKK